jgi:metal-responsive CopG/Arc/MetJ family transcriptional regulator
MNLVRINVNLPKETFNELNKTDQSRKISRFVYKAIRNVLKEQRDQRFAKEYAETPEEPRRMN